MVNLEGQCLCGAVLIKAVADTPILRACHCDMCRRHTSGMFVSISNDAAGISNDQITVLGPAKTYQSSDWATRGFCAVCGSTLWYSTVHDGVRNLSAGLFSDLGDARMKIEFFADNCPSGYALAGDHPKLNAQETIALFTDEGDNQ